LAELEDVFLFALPTHARSWNRDGSFDWDDSGCKSECSWFGFMMTVRDEAPFSRTDFARFLTERKIGNRMLFGGNLVRQPAFVAIRRETPERIRTVGDLSGADAIMNQTIFIGTYPGLTRPMLDYVIESIHEYVRTKKSAH
jgi:CDP-6-deoxy-D-xylo-4-hexulose-3-dehydrase